MADWEGFLNNFLRDVELPVLDNTGSISHSSALTFAKQQYEQFAEQRRLQAQEEADQRYIDDLKQTAKSLERKGRKGGAL